MEETLPKTLPKYSETEQSRQARKTQRKVWMKYVCATKLTGDDNVSNVFSTSLTEENTVEEESEEAEGENETEMDEN